MPVPYSPLSMQAYTRTPSRQPLVFGRRGTDHLLRSDDLVVPKLPTCGCEVWRRLDSPSTGGDWWATCHDKSCARYSRLRCGIRVSPLRSPPFTYRGSVPLGRHLRVLCLETELEKRTKKSGFSISLSVPLDKGDRVRTVWYRQICLTLCVVSMCSYG